MIVAATILVLAGSAIGYVGRYLNVKVKKANGGKMPVIVTSVEQRERLIVSKTHCPMDDSTVHPSLGDIHPFGPLVLSIGDLITYFGVGLMAVGSLLSLWVTLGIRYGG